MPPFRRRVPVPGTPPSHPGPRPAAPYRQVVRLIWLYLWLLIFEGALRKWFLPGFASYILVIRDPVALAIIIVAWRDGMKLSQGIMAFFGGTIILFSLFGLIQIATGLISAKVFLFGMRTYFLHLPLVFIMGRALTADDVHRLVRWTLLISLPMTALMAVQFVSSPGAWINKGVGEDGTQLLSARDHVRAAGTFSFVSGTIAFCTLALACCLAQFFRRQKAWNINHLTLACSILVAATSGSRGLIVCLAIVVLAMVTCVILRPAAFAGGAKMVLVAGISVVLLTLTSLFREGVATLSERTLEAGDAEGGSAGFLARIGGELAAPLGAGLSVPFYGGGIGLGTNVGAALATGEVGFLMAEGEWGRVFGETGFLGGLLFIGFRTWVVCWLFLKSVKMAKQGYMLPLLLSAAAAPQMWNGQWGQPTALGFAIFVSGLAWAALQAAPPVLCQPERRAQPPRVPKRPLAPA